MKGGRKPRGRHFALVVISGLSLIGCPRDPIRCVSTLEEGDLVVTEIRGEQGDSFGQWIEVCNSGPFAKRLAGLIIRFTKLDGSGVREVLVRDYHLFVEGGGCAVLGILPDGQEREGEDVMGEVAETPRPDWLDYDFSLDWDLKSLYKAGVVELLACGRLVDRVVYKGLPEKGTLSLDPEVGWSSEANDDPLAWCVDDHEEDGAFFGTPGEVNRPCK